MLQARVTPSTASVVAPFIADNSSFSVWRAVPSRLEGTTDFWRAYRVSGGHLEGIFLFGEKMIVLL